MTHSGVGPVTELATDVFLGDPKRFVGRKTLASYVGIIPREYSSGGRQKFAELSKQGNPLLRFSGVCLERGNTELMKTNGPSNLG
jgi:transposase